MADGDIKQNDASHFSVLVPKSATDATVRDYLRLGDTDPADEATLRDPSRGQAYSPAKGALVYSTEEIDLVAPTINQISGQQSDFAGDRLSYVGSGDHVVSATRTWGSAAYSATANFQWGNLFNTTMGNTASLVEGNSVTQWLGNDASTGIGSLLWSNYGSTQNVFGGQIVNIVNSGIDVQGFGEAKILNNYSLVAGTSLALGVTPAALTAPWAGVPEKLATIGTLIAAVTAGLGSGATLGLEIWQAGDARDGAAVRDAMAGMLATTAAVTGAVVALQIMAVAAGAAALIAGTADSAAAAARIEIDAYSITFRAGNSAIGISPTNIYKSSPLTQTETVFDQTNADTLAFEP